MGKKNYFVGSKMEKLCQSKEWNHDSITFTSFFRQKCFSIMKFSRYPFYPDIILIQNTKAMRPRNEKIFNAQRSHWQWVANLGHTSPRVEWNMKDNTQKIYHTHRITFFACCSIGPSRSLPHLTHICVVHTYVSVSNDMEVDKVTDEVAD